MGRQSSNAGRDGSWVATHRNGWTTTRIDWAVEGRTCMDDVMHDGFVGANRTRAMRWHSCMHAVRRRRSPAGPTDHRWSWSCTEAAGAVRGRASNKPAGLWIFICSLALHWHDRLGCGGWRNNLFMLLSAIYVGIKASCRREKSIVLWSLMLYFQRQRQLRRRSYAWQSAHDEA
jgi:hypothetical protein